MRLQDFIIALMFFITASIVCLALMFDMYGTDGYDIDLSNDTSTAVLSDLQTRANQAQNDAKATNEDIWNRTAGQPDASIDSGEVTEGDMIKSALKALTNVGDYIDVFTSMGSAVFRSLRLDVNGPIFWFLISTLIVLVSYILLSSVLRNWL